MRDDGKQQIESCDPEPQTFPNTQITPVDSDESVCHGGNQDRSISIWRRGSNRPIAVLADLISQAYPPFRALTEEAKKCFTTSYNREEEAWKNNHSKSLLEHESKLGRRKPFTNKTKAERTNFLNDLLARFLTVKEQEAWFRKCMDLAVIMTHDYLTDPIEADLVQNPQQQHVDDGPDGGVPLPDEDSEDELDRKIRKLKQEVEIEELKIRKLKKEVEIEELKIRLQTLRNSQA